MLDAALAFCVDDGFQTDVDGVFEAARTEKRRVGADSIETLVER